MGTQKGKKKKKQASKKKNDKKTKKNNKKTQKKASTKKVKKTEQKTTKTSRKRKKIQVRKVKEYMGVYTRGNGRFFCTARKDGKQKYVGSFLCPKECAREYDKFVFSYRGDEYMSYNYPKLLGLGEKNAYKYKK